VTRRRRSVVWTEVAARDVEQLAAYLAADAPVRAPLIVERIISLAESLAVFPERGRVPPELRGIGDRRWREVQEPPWRIIYKVASSRRVEIHAVLDGRRSLEDLLMERLLRD
jgi:toxin ParE1/3/4